MTRPPVASAPPVPPPVGSGHAGATAGPAAPVPAAGSTAWRPTAALVRALSLAIGSLGLALSLGRPDLAAIGAPVVFGLLMALTARSPDRTGAMAVRARAVAEPVAGRVIDLDVEVSGAARCQLVTVAVPDPADGPVGGRLTVPGASALTLRVPVRVPDWGTSALARPDLWVCGPDALWERGPLVGPELLAVIAPEKVAQDPLQLPPVSGGWAGDHVSRRPGQGGDLVDLREFAPGDRLKSIHWRAFARHQRLYVRRTDRDADVEFVLCLDTRAEVRPAPRPPSSAWVRRWRRWRVRGARAGRLLRGMVVPARPVARSEGESGPRTSLDLTVSAAAAIAGAQLRVGDRVGLLDLSTYRRHIRMGNGTRHLDRIRHQLGQLDFSDWPWLVRAELWGLPAGAVVVILSPLTDEAVLTAALDCQARGHLVVVVDVLPEADLVAVNRGPVEAFELDLLLAERNARTASLRNRGIPLVRWEDGDLAATLARFRRAYRERR